MKKRIFLGLVLAAAAAGAAFAAPEFKLSAGAGGYFTSDFGGGAEGSMGGQSGSLNTPYFGGGGFAFFDATFAEASLGFFGGGGSAKFDGALGDAETDMSFMGLDIGLLGKYPFAINEKLTISPMLGITYRVVLSAKDEDGDEIKNSDGDDAAGDFSALWFRFGGGVDYAFTDNLYVRGGLLYGLRLANKFEDDMVDSFKQQYPGIDANTLLGHGLEVKIAVGCRF
jgi:opacity protein-like surface antigen